MTDTDARSAPNPAPPTPAPAGVAEPSTAPGAVDRLTDLVEAAEGDRRARRRLLDRASRVLAADAEAERRSRSAVADAERRARAVEADAEARIRSAEARLRVQERERAASRAERDAERAEKTSEREVKAEQSAFRRAAWTHRREIAGAAAPAMLSMFVYLAAVASAVFGQVSVATGRYGWSMFRALLLAGFIELMALAMATTANWLRLRGERAMAPRVLTWIFACFAASINIWGHLSDPLMATGLGAASLGGITLWEIRSSARHRETLRKVGQLGQPLPGLGLRFWLFQPSIAVCAYRLGVRSRVAPAAAPLVAQAEASHRARKEQRQRRPRWGLWLAAAFAAGITTTVGATMLLPTNSQVRPLWWLAGGFTTTVLFAMSAVATRRVTSTLPPVPESATLATRDTIQVPAEPTPSPVTPDSVTPDQTMAGPTATEQTVAEQTVAEQTVAEQTVAEQTVAEQTVVQPAPTEVLTDTGEFRMLTSPAHYGLNGIGVAEPVPVAVASANGSKRPGVSGAAGLTIGGPELGQTRRVPPRRTGIPDEARAWITECLRSDQSPTGPEVGRRFRVDPSTGRRWVRQIRDSM